MNTSILSLVQETAQYLLDNKAHCLSSPDFFTCNEISEQLYIRQQLMYGTTNNILSSVGVKFIREILNPALAMEGYQLIHERSSAFITSYIERVSDSNSAEGESLLKSMRIQWLEYIINYEPSKMMDSKQGDYTILYKGKWFNSFSTLWRYCQG